MVADFVWPARFRYHRGDGKVDSNSKVEVRELIWGGDSGELKMKSWAGEYYIIYPTQRAVGKIKNGDFPMTIGRCKGGELGQISEEDIVSGKYRPVEVVSWVLGALKSVREDLSSHFIHGVDNLLSDVMKLEKLMEEG